jgi:folate-dependent phosphoribosylglycinamide formyltransferase PurN
MKLCVAVRQTDRQIAEAFGVIYILRPDFIRAYANRIGVRRCPFRFHSFSLSYLHIHPRYIPIFTGYFSMEPIIDIGKGRL